MSLHDNEIPENRMLDDQCPNCGHHWDLGELREVIEKLTDNEWMLVTGATSSSCRLKSSPIDEYYAALDRREED